MSQAILQQANALHQQGQLAEAESLYQQAIAADPNNVQPRYLLAFLRYQQQRHGEALQALEEALQRDPGAPAERIVQARMLQGALFQAMGRRDEALTAFSQVTQQAPHHAEAWHNRGVLLSELGRLVEAIPAFDRSLAIQPGAMAWNNRGTALMGLLRFADASQSFFRGLALQPDSALILYNLGNALKACARLPEALSAFDQVIARDPQFFMAWNGRGNVLHDTKQFAEALASYDRALAIAPGYAQGWNNRGAVLQSLKRFDEAVASYDRALAAKPDYAEAGNGRALALYAMERFADALAGVDKALIAAPDYPPALFTRARILCESNRTEEGLATFRRHAALPQASNPIAAVDDPPFKRAHDAEQRAYLAELGVPPPGDAFYFTDGERLAGAAVNPANAAPIAAEWARSSPQIVVADNFLTSQALENLRRYCWGSTVWREAHSEGYLGAMHEHGFGCPLLAQIAEELRHTFPSIFGEHGLRLLWGFKYDSNLAGIVVHADQAAVNVNFWITPDEANRDPASGGLVIWDANAPLDWDFANYNVDTPKIRDFLASAGAKPTTVPYRANRAVIFDSDLFHETDKFDFREGYCNRRINITMLFGRRIRDGS